MTVTFPDSATHGEINTRDTVTATDGSADETIATRDNDVRTAWLRASRQHGRAKKTAEVCGHCGRDLVPTETIYRGRTFVGSFPGSWISPAGPVHRDSVLCLDCAGSVAKGRPARSCSTCGRGVIRSASARPCYWLFCCHRCEWQHQNRIRDQRAAKARQKVCASCGEAFTAARSDALTCSASCRQRLHRQQRRAA
jgi:hypothetical protein